MAAGSPGVAGGAVLDTAYERCMNVDVHSRAGEPAPAPPSCSSSSVQTRFLNVLHEFSSIGEQTFFFVFH